MTPWCFSEVRFLGTSRLVLNWILHFAKGDRSSLLVYGDILFRDTGTDKSTLNTKQNCKKKLLFESFTR